MERDALALPDPVRIDSIGVGAFRDEGDGVVMRRNCEHVRKIARDLFGQGGVRNQGKRESLDVFGDAILQSINDKVLGLLMPRRCAVIIALGVGKGDSSVIQCDVLLNVAESARIRVVRPGDLDGKADILCSEGVKLDGNGIAAPRLRQHCERVHGKSDASGRPHKRRRESIVSGYVERKDVIVGNRPCAREGLSLGNGESNDFDIFGNFVFLGHNGKVRGFAADAHGDGRTDVVAADGRLSGFAGGIDQEIEAFKRQHPAGGDGNVVAGVFINVEAWHRKSNATFYILVAVGDADQPVIVCAGRIIGGQSAELHSNAAVLLVGVGSRIQSEGDEAVARLEGDSAVTLRVRAVGCAEAVGVRVVTNCNGNGNTLARSRVDGEMNSSAIALSYRAGRRYKINRAHGVLRLDGENVVCEKPSQRQWCFRDKRERHNAVQSKGSEGNLCRRCPVRLDYDRIAKGKGIKSAWTRALQREIDILRNHSARGRGNNMKHNVLVGNGGVGSWIIGHSRLRETDGCAGERGVIVGDGESVHPAIGRKREAVGDGIGRVLGESDFNLLVYLDRVVVPDADGEFPGSLGRGNSNSAAVGINIIAEVGDHPVQDNVGRVGARDCHSQLDGADVFVRRRGSR